MRDADKQQLDRTAALVRDVLGPNVVGAYLFGSAVLGGLQPRSDLDVFVVTKRATNARRSCCSSIGCSPSPGGRRRKAGGAMSS